MADRAAIELLPRAWPPCHGAKGWRRPVSRFADCRQAVGYGLWNGARFPGPAQYAFLDYRARGLNPLPRWTTTGARPPGRDHRQENCKALVKASGVAQEGRAPPGGCGHAPVFSAPLRANAGLGLKKSFPPYREKNKHSISENTSFQVTKSREGLFLKGFLNYLY